ncbi:sorting nexin-16 isoform X1 [Pseudoliparis swirei]|uniref:sorting nexin-16 isoform X1 n=1 Tax=Pseudoliparis swirei TaxID=2059687 RepID=UPI0024BD9670|nr:sorting nexin-16 isoform X1 [Pseudoliparis swirei]
MASPFVPVPMPMDRTRAAGSSKLRRPQRASSLGSVSGALAGEDHGRGCGGLDSRRQSRGIDRGSRSRTSPPLLSPVTLTRGNGALEPSIEYSCPRSISDPVGSQQGEERPITPTLLGYEVMEERAKFTVFKVLVRKTPDENWVVFRRYTDFSRLNDKLKEMFPGFRLSLPPKRWFKDNYDSDFLEDRLLGLQTFLQNLVAHKDIANCLAVREFLCLDDPPGPFDSLEESRAFCETLEESNYRLQKELLEKQKEIASLKRSLQEREQAVLLLEKHINGECVSPESLCGLLARGSESSADVESSAAEADQDVLDDAGGRCEVQPVQSSACWCGPPPSTSPPVIEVTQLNHQKLQQ